MNSIIVLEWSFSPADFFEAPIEIRRDNYTLKFADGNVRCELLASVFDTNPDVRKTIQLDIENRFLAYVVVSHESYDLWESTMLRVHPNGNKDYYLNVHDAIHACTVSTLDIQVTDEHGNVTADTRRDRIMNQESFAERMANHRNDPSLAVMIGSFNSAIRDPNHVLLHLYEIREIITTRYGSAAQARAALEISLTKWSDFGKLCCDLPLRQGRHASRKFPILRDATETELAEGRSFAQKLILQYLITLENAGSNVNG